MTMTEQTIGSPVVIALALRGLTDGIQTLSAQIEAGQAKDATKEQRAEAEQAAQVLLRNSPLAVAALHKLERFAEATTEAASARRDDIMTSMFGPDTE